jgi:hypothetical protein
MKITEITRPSNIRDAKFILSRNGYEQLGHGVYGTVFAKHNEPIVLKLFGAEDTSYVAFLNLITKVKNPHFPVVKGKPIKINDEYWAARLERLEPIEGANVELQKYVKLYVINYQKLAELENEYYTKSTMDQKARSNITDEDRDLLNQLGDIPDDWKSYQPRTHPDDRLLPARINAVRQKVLAFEKHFPDLAEALRLIDQYVLYGMPADLHTENVMQRGPTLVITDPSSGGAEGSLIPPPSPHQPQLFQEPGKAGSRAKRTWDQQQQQTNYKSLSYNLPRELKGYGENPQQRDFDDPKTFRDVY